MGAAGGVGPHGLGCSGAPCCEWRASDLGKLAGRGIDTECADAVSPGICDGGEATCRID